MVPSIWNTRTIANGKFLKILIYFKLPEMTFKNTPFPQNNSEPVPLEKLAKIFSPVEKYSPNFVPTENDHIKQILTAR